MDFPENFLHFIWQYRLFNPDKLFCVGGEVLKVLHPGLPNKHAGPDFSQAKLLIGQTTWVGHVEIHLKSSDWISHGHQHDAFYDAVILHVVYKHDRPICRANGSLLPVFVLENRIADHLRYNYQELITSLNKFPCEKHIADVDKFIIDSFLSRIAVERLEQKAREVFQKLDKNKGDWEQTYYYFMARNFGFKVNGLPFELLADSLPQQIFSRHKDNPMQISALLFGQAGFLAQQFNDEYPGKLKAEYTFLKKKYRLTPINSVAWKFLRMRPQNFPTLRLAQFGALISKSSHLFSRILEISLLSDLYALFSDLPVHHYWQTHYHFNKSSGKVPVQPGSKTVQNMIINTVCLFLFAYGKYTDELRYIDRALDFLEKIPAEHNSIVDEYIDAGIKVDRAFMSQALLQLNKYYCTQKKCLNCSIGIKILKK